MPSTSTKIGHGLAKVLGIDLHYRHETGSDRVTRGESVFSIDSANTYVEEEPTALEWLHEVLPTGQGILTYIIQLFPFLRWITRYNVQWLLGDLVAGITVGAVVVPQSMAYSKLAQLPPEFGLYSSFMGVLIYWFFATSKDITIGPVAVLSTVTGNVVTSALEKLPEGTPPEYIASSLAVIAGSIVLFLGLARLGWVVEFISLPAISAFMTGSAISIAVGQIPAMMGINNLFSTRDATYLVFINTLKHLGSSNLNAAIGLTALVMLYAIRTICTLLAKRYPSRAKTFFFVSTLRTAFVILLYILISYLANRNHRKKPLFSVLGNVPRGFKHARVPPITTPIIKSFLGELPSTVIVLLIEHISISKSFGRVNNYTIDPSQELVAIGVTNVLGPFLGAYPATGSFSRTAIKSKAGVRTPFAGVITAVIVLLAIYALPAMFWYIPNAGLAAVIIHAVLDLITPPNTVYQFWRISPLEVIVFFAGVIVTVFTTIEIGIYVTVSASAAIWWFRTFKARGRFLGKAKIHSVIGDHLLHPNENDKEAERSPRRNPVEGKDSVRSAFLPIDHHDGSNPMIELEDPYPGIFIYRFAVGFFYPNANHHLDTLVHTIFQKTRRTNPATYGRPGDRPWNDPGPRKGKEVDETDNRPTLKAIILDFSAVDTVDLTSIQNLIDVRNQLDRFAAPDTVDWHFCHINNRWTKRALAAAGFGYYTPDAEGSEIHRWKPIFSVAEIGGPHSAAAEAEARENRRALKAAAQRDTEADGIDDRIAASSASSEEESLDKQLSHSKAYGAVTTKASTIAVVQGLNRPLFHLDIQGAMESALANAQRKSH
ncbi:unnamed protein product [Periconia digitata]|uniref:STAS domain-containing protein n=1 Tax=Periconia digitata TaxID=1303443 RepID=A0A9W4UCP3_9PLEO|nr:unnamed protein product [Periconia digitata]